MRLTRATWVVAALAVGAAALVITTLVKDDGRPEILVGSALDVGNPFEVKGPLAPGQELVETYGIVKNDSGNDVHLKAINPVVGDGVPTHGEVLEVFILEMPFESSLFNTLPPVLLRSGNCQTAKLQPVNGYVLEPGGEVFIAMHIAAHEPGTFRIPSSNIIYRLNGQTFRQSDLFSFIGKVRPGFERETSAAERRCKGVEALPAGR